MTDLERIGDELAAELSRHGPRYASDTALAALVAAWPAAVGDGIARNAWPSRIARDGTLHVATTSSAWGFELTQLGEEIRAKLAAVLGPDGTPRTLRFAPGKVPAPGPDPAAQAPPPPLRPTAQHAAAAEALAASVASPELRDAIARAARASLARRDAAAGGCGPSGRALAARDEPSARPRRRSARTRSQAPFTPPGSRPL